MPFSNLFVKKVVQDLTSGGVDWQREKWQSGFGSKFIRQGEKNAVKYADEKVDPVSRKYIVCAGKNKCDWDTVVKAYKESKVDLDLHLIGGKEERFQNIDGIEQIPYLPINDFIEQVQGAEFCVLPLEPVLFSFGQMRLLQQMALRKCVIVSDAPSILDYVENNWLYSALEDFRYITIRSIIFKVISVVLMLLLVRNQEDYILYECILVLATVGSNILNFVHAREYIDMSQLKNMQIKRHIVPIFMFAAASIAGTINANTDTAMLGFLKSDYDVGLYSFSIKFKNLLISINNAALTVMVPRLSFYAGQHKMIEFRELLKKAADSVMAIACGVPIFFCIFAPETVLILGGKEYLVACPTMIVLNL